MKNFKVYHPSKSRRDFVKLDLNESYYFLDGKIIEKFKKFNRFTLSSYPEYENLTKSLAKYAKCKAENICLTNGSDRAIQLLLQLFFHENDEVIVPSPTFFVYFSVLDFIKAKVKSIYYKKENNRFIFPFNETIKAINKNSKGLLLCNPNNPLGSSIPQIEINALLKKTHKLHIPVIIDEAYFEFYEKTSVNLLKKYDNLIIIRTFSKSFGLAGLRLGYILAHENVIEKLSKLKLTWEVNHFATYAGETVLNNLSYFKNKVKKAQELKVEFIKFLEKDLGFFCYDTDTNFILIKSNQKNLAKYLKSKKILVNDVSKYPFNNNILSNIVRANIPSKKDLEYIKTKLKKTI